jgi:hypothetical protein
MKLVNFTEENLSKIHISQFEQFLDKHKFSYSINVIGSDIFHYE